MSCLAAGATQATPHIPIVTPQQTPKPQHGKRTIHYDTYQR